MCIFVCRCYLTHLPAQQPRAARFLAYGTAPVLQTLHSDPNKSENLSWLLTWADSSCITATYLPKLSPPTPFLPTFQEKEHIFFTFPPGLSHLLSACSTWKKYEIPQLGFTNINKKNAKTTYTSASLSCHIRWLSHKHHSGLMQSLWGKTPHSPEANQEAESNTRKKGKKKILRVLQN